MKIRRSIFTYIHKTNGETHYGFTNIFLFFLQNFFCTTRALTHHRWVTQVHCYMAVTSEGVKKQHWLGICNTKEVLSLQTEQHENFVRVVLLGTWWTEAANLTPFICRLISTWLHLVATFMAGFRASVGKRGEKQSIQNNIGIFCVVIMIFAIYYLNCLNWKTFSIWTHPAFPFYLRAHG